MRVWWKEKFAQNFEFGSAPLSQLQLQVDLCGMACDVLQYDLRTFAIIAQRIWFVVHL